MDSYEMGIAWCAGFASARFLYGLLTRFNLFHSNMRLMGFRQSWVSGAYKQSGSAVWEIPVFVACAGATALLSWLGLFLEVVYYIHAVAKDFGPPREIADLRWRLRNCHMDTATAHEIGLRLGEIVLCNDIMKDARDETGVQRFDSAA